MSCSDPIADYLTCIRNAGRAKHKSVDVPESQLKLALTRVLLREKFISRYIRIRDGRQGLIRMWLRYTAEGRNVIDTVRRVSTPGRRIYYGVDEIPRVLNGLGLMILTTPKGVLTDGQARAMRVGGEPLCEIW